MTKMTNIRRPKGSGYKSMATILRFLMDDPRCFQEIVNRTKLHRNTVVANLKILVAIDYVRKERKGRKVMYHAVDDERELAGIRLAFLEEYSTRKALDEAEKTCIKNKRWEARVTLEWIKNVRKYKNELADLGPRIPDLEKYQLHEIFGLAKEHRKTKREAKRVRISLPSENTEIKDVKSVVQSLIDFERNYPKAIKVLKKNAALRKKNRFHPPKGTILLVCPAHSDQ